MDQQREEEEDHMLLIWIKTPKHTFNVTRHSAQLKCHTLSGKNKFLKTIKYLNKVL